MKREAGYGPVLGDMLGDDGGLRSAFLVQNPLHGNSL